MKRRDHLLARRGVEVDEHVAAEDDVDVADEAHHRVVDQVDLAEADERAHFIAHLLLAVDLAEVAAQELFVGGAERGAAVGALRATCRQRREMSLPKTRTSQSSKSPVSCDQDGDGVRLFARRAAGATRRSADGRAALARRARAGSRRGSAVSW